MNYTFETIGIVNSCYKDKFAIPRQAGLVPSATAFIELLEPYNNIDMVKGLDGFSHLWLSFIFHKHVGKGWNHMVKPPRLDGKQKFGVFATRASFRPNPIGLSLVKFESIEQTNKQLFIHISGADLLDQTPIIDIKPYIPYSDSIPNALGGFTDDIKESTHHIKYSLEAEKDCLSATLSYPDITNFINQLLSLDHRAYYYKKIDKIYSTTIYDFDLKWRIIDTNVIIVSLKKIPST